jgi:hypothetical protein
MYIPAQTKAFFPGHTVLSAPDAAAGFLPAVIIA